MTTRTQRINVTLKPGDLEIVLFLSKKKKLSSSKIISEIVEKYLEDYEDMMFAKEAEEIEKNSTGYITHAELCKRLGL